MVLVAGPSDVVNSLVGLLSELKVVRSDVCGVFEGSVLGLTLTIAATPRDSMDAVSWLVEQIHHNRPRALVLPSVGDVPGAAAGDVVVAAAARLSRGGPAFSMAPELGPTLDWAENDWIVNTQRGASPAEIVGKIVRGTASRYLQAGSVATYVDHVAPLAMAVGTGVALPVCAFRVVGSMGDQWVIWHLRAFCLATAIALCRRGEAA